MSLVLDGTNGVTYPNSSTQTVGGVGSASQTWQNVLASRAAGTTYTNSTGYPIQVLIQANSSTSSITLNGTTPAFVTSVSYTIYSFIIPNGQTYVYNSAAAALVWMELR